MKTHRLFTRASGAILVLTLLLVSPMTRGQAPLADRVPADAVAYLGWAGSENVPGFAGSRFEALLNASNMPEAFRQAVPALIRRLALEDAEAARHADQVYKLLTLVSKHPTAVFFAGIAQGPDGNPVPRMGLVCRVGAERAAQLRDQIAPMIADAPNDAMVRVGVDGDDLAVMVGYEDVNAALAKDAAGSLGGAAAFTGAMQQVRGEGGTGPAFCGWLNVEQAFRILDEIVRAEAPEESQAMYDKIVEATGLRGIKHGVFASGFDGKDWMSNTFLAAPAPRKGLVSLIDGPPIGDDLLKAIPMDAEVAMVGSLDLAQIINTLREAAGQVDPEYKKNFDQGLGAAQMALGTNLQTNVLEPLGPHWALYSARGVAGGGLPGVVLVNKPDDAAKARQGLTSVTIFANNMSSTFLAQEDIFVQVKPLKVGDQDIQYVAVPFVAPSWSVVDNYAMFGLFPQTLVDARRSMSGGKSILDNPQYQALRQRLGQKEVRSIFYADLPQTAADSYWLMLVVSRLAGFGDMLAGVPTPPMIMPPYSTLKEHLTVAGGVSWVDDAGLHARSVGPFPGAELFQGTVSALPALVAQTPMFAAAGLPAMTQARGNAQRTQCASHMRQIGMGAHLYANENRGQFPEDLGTILKTQDIELNAFTCPSSGLHLGEAQAMEMDQRADWVNQNSGYVWLGAGKTTREGPDSVLMYERPENHKDGVNVLFADGHTEYMRRAEAEQRIPGIQFPPRR